MPPIRALIVDDEPFARRRVAQLLAEHPEVEIIGECADGVEAVHAIETLAPDLVFLDVQMPEMDGFEVLAALDAEHMPAVVFATAFDDFALRAFNANAVDYLLKPFNAERFAAAVERARERIGRGEQAEITREVRSLLESLRAARRYPERLVVRVGTKIVFVRVADVDWIEAEANYVRVHSSGRSFLLRETLTHLAGRLPPERFLRIHRSTVVNIDRIKEIHPMFKGTYHIRLHDGTELSSTLTYRDAIHELIEGSA
jgi:two-component system LytT family response regulator